MTFLNKCLGQIFSHLWNGIQIFPMASGIKCSNIKPCADTTDRLYSQRNILLFTWWVYNQKHVLKDQSGYPFCAGYQCFFLYLSSVWQPKDTCVPVCLGAQCTCMQGNMVKLAFTILAKLTFCIPPIESPVCRCRGTSVTHTRLWSPFQEAANRVTLLYKG